MKRAILAVSFGTSYPDTLEKTIAATERTLAEAFPEWEVRRAFTSGKIIQKIQRRDGVTIDHVSQAMTRLEAEGFTHVAVQSTHVMHGEEYEKMLAQLSLSDGCRYPSECRCSTAKRTMRLWQTRCSNGCQDLRRAKRWC